MTFLNTGLAFGACAFVIPLIIHLLNRSRFRTVEWGAMHLLESVITANHRRFRIEQLILLLIRCAIPILLALCLARPVLTGSQILAGNSPSSLVILLDNSYSMDAVSNGKSHFDAAVDAAISIVEQTSRGSEISVILTGGRPVSLFDQPVFDPAAITRKLKQLQGGYGANRMSAAIDIGLKTVAEMSHARRELIVICDFQPEDWETIQADLPSIRHQLDEMEVTPHLSLLPVGKPLESNVSINSLEFSERALGIGQQLVVRAEIKNHGNTDYQQLRVILKVDGNESDISQVSLNAEGTTQVIFTCEFEQAGSHVIEAEVIADDQLPTDNRHAAAVTVWENLQVLLVDGDPSREPLKSETDFLSVALTPFTFGRVRLIDLMQTERVTSKELAADHFKEKRVVVLANVSKLDDKQFDALSEYVGDGGALLICSGDRIDLNWYKERMYDQGNGLLPMVFGARKGKKDSTARLVSQFYEHPALAYFNEPNNGDLSSIEFGYWNELISLGEAEDDTISIMARLDTGDALLVQKEVGDGVVVQLATACDDSWSNAPLRPVYVPLMQQLVSQMASRISPPRNIQTGEPAVAIIETDAESNAVMDSVTVISPDGSRRAIQTTSRGKIQLASFANTERPGIYSMTTPTTETIHFVATTSRNESRLDRMNEQQQKELSEGLAAQRVESVSSYIELENVRRQGREIWKYLLVALVALLMLEVILQQQFAKVRT
ncbi:VWA domain-containing protein [Calycomorphotria hydatis]|uniref:VWFA domain-containing protein n=1 Tax=Calycomorphotria hydatis TaxID=2528027 RepID=A0A517TEH6_9PLAN|nr:VWA domain-containing protein [Calycomorphotria hydatis]QDT66774.1 hypothetical protein V22_40450 [Calycomorphotria hydatis]